jgi:hypothetical protein
MPKGAIRIGCNQLCRVALQRDRLDNSTIKKIVCELREPKFIFQKYHSMKRKVAGVFVGALLLLPMTIAQSYAQSPSPSSTTQVISLPRANGLASPLELQQFAQAIKQLRKVEMETQKKMAEALKEEGLSPSRFQEIGQRQDNPDSPLTVDISPKEQQQFDKALAKINQIQQDAAPKQNRAVTLQGLTLERFNQIGRAIEQNPALKRQLRENI